MRQFRDVPDGAGELNVNWRLAGVSPRTVGVVLQIARRDTRGEHAETTIRWYDRSAARLLAGAELFTADGRGRADASAWSATCATRQLRSPPTRPRLRAPTAVCRSAAPRRRPEPTPYAVPHRERCPWLVDAGRDARGRRGASPEPPSPVHVAPLGRRPRRAHATVRPPGHPQATAPKPDPRRSRPASRPRPPKPTEPARQVPVRGADLRRRARRVHANGPSTRPRSSGHVLHDRGAGRRVPLSPAGSPEAGLRSAATPTAIPISPRLSAARDRRTSSSGRTGRSPRHRRRPTLLRPPYGARDQQVDQRRRGPGRVR